MAHDESFGRSAEQAQPSELALRAWNSLATQQLGDVYQAMRAAEQYYPGDLALCLEGGAEALLPTIEYGEQNAPQFQSWSVTASSLLHLQAKPGSTIRTAHSEELIGEGAFLGHSRVLPQDYGNIEYEFGGGALSEREVRDVMGPSFHDEAVQVLRGEADSPYRTAILRRELFPGVFLNVRVAASASDNYEGETENFSVEYAYASVPLVAEQGWSGVRLLDYALEGHRRDFRQRYAAALEDADIVDQLFTHGQSENEAELQQGVLQAAYGALGVVERRSGNVEARPEFAAAIRDPRLSEDIRLYLAARMLYDLHQAGSGATVAAEGGDTFDDVVAAHEQLYEARSAAAQRKRLEQWRAMEARNNLPPRYTDQEAMQQAVDHLTDLLANILVQRTPEDELPTDMQDEARGILCGKIAWQGEPSPAIMQLTLTYDTITGLPRYVPSHRRDFLPADFSRVHAQLIRRGESYELKPVEVTRLMPAASEVAYSSLREEAVARGQALYGEPGSGDAVMQAAVEAFNARFGNAR